MVASFSKPSWSLLWEGVGRAAASVRSVRTEWHRLCTSPWPALPGGLRRGGGKVGRATSISLANGETESLSLFVTQSFLLCSVASVSRAAAPVSTQCPSPPSPICPTPFHPLTHLRQGCTTAVPKKVWALCEKKLYLVICKCHRPMLYSH